METHAGGCLCGAVRYETAGAPQRVTVCHCRYCQRATGAAYMVEPIFPLAALRVTQGTPAVHSRASAGSGKRVHAHFCAACGTRLFLTFERWPESCGIYAGTYDDPGWIVAGPENSRHIFTSVRRPDTVLPAAVALYAEHVAAQDGTPLPARVLDAPE